VKSLKKKKIEGEKFKFEPRMQNVMASKLEDGGGN